MSDRDFQERDRVGRLNRWVRAHPVIVLLVLAMFLVSTLGGVIRVGQGVWRWWDETQNWREHEYHRLASLHSDYTLSRLEQELGAPLFARPSRNGQWLEYVFRGRDYWVQAIGRTGSDSVATYAVTSCASDFQPTFVLPDGSKVRLQSSRLRDIRGWAYRYAYTFPASSMPSFFESSFESHATNFKSFAWGWNGACTVTVGSAVDRAYRAGLALTFEDWTGEVRALPEGARAAVGDVPVNTFIEWGPMASDFPVSLSFGVDEITVESVTNQTSRAGGE